MNLFSQLEVEPTYEELAPGAVLMRGLALSQDREFLAAIDDVIAAAPLRHTTTPSGLPMSVMSTNCGNWRWISRPAVADSQFSAISAPRPRPLMPRTLSDLAIRAAKLAGFPKFTPDSCHINRYQARTKLGLHQDRHECDLTQPIVSVSFGLECIFLLGGLQRTEKPKRILLEHGDIFGRGETSRLRFTRLHPLNPASH